MLFAFILIALITSAIVTKSRPRLAGTLDLCVATIVLLARVLPGNADVFDWMLMVLLFLGGAYLLINGKHPTTRRKRVQL